MLKSVPQLLYPQGALSRPHSIPFCLQKGMRSGEPALSGIEERDDEKHSKGNPTIRNRYPCRGIGSDR
jgi:hypothetical protein